MCPGLEDLDDTMDPCGRDLRGDHQYGWLMPSHEGGSISKFAHIEHETLSDEAFSEASRTRTDFSYVPREIIWL